MEFKTEYIRKNEIKEELLIFILTGQKRKDNIFPVKKRWGTATARKNISDLKTILEKDKDLKDRFNFNRKLIDLDLIPDDIWKEIEENLETPQFNFDLSKLIQFCSRYKLRQHMDLLNKLKVREGSGSALW